MGNELTFLSMRDFTSAMFQEGFKDSEYHWLRVGSNRLLNVQIRSDGKIAFYPVALLDQHNVNPSVQRRRITSFTKFYRWMVEAYKKPDGEFNVQAVQDYLLKWVAENTHIDFDKYKFEEVTGEAVVEAYRVGPESCMKGKKAQLQVYVINPDKVSVLKIYENGEYIARALVWNTNDGRRLLDRVYPSGHRIGQTARLYAESQGWLTTTYDSVGADIKNNEQVSVTLKHPTNRRLPYMDTVRFVEASNDQHLTLSSQYRAADGNSRPSISFTEGYAHGIYPNMRYLDGSQVVNPFELSPYGGYRFNRNNSRSTYVNFTDRTVRQIVLRPGDVLYRLPGGMVYPPQRIVEHNGSFYKKSECRKVRGRDEYIPKPGAVAYSVGLSATHIVTLLEVK